MESSANMIEGTRASAARSVSSNSENVGAESEQFTCKTGKDDSDSRAGTMQLSHEAMKIQAAQ
jgi:hypothetical protein